MITLGDVVARLAGMQADVEQRIAASLRLPVAAALARPPYERSEALLQLLHLSSGEDCNYDRPTLGTAYALWYHARRTHDAVRAIAPHLVRTQGRNMDILDLGTGSGATAWAVAIVEEALHQLGSKPRTVALRCVDASPIMLDTAEMMWSGFSNDERSFSARVTVDWLLRPWADVQFLRSGSFVVAGFVFDHTDQRIADHVGTQFARLLDYHQASGVALLGPANKRAILDAVLQSIDTSADWHREPVPVPAPMWTGKLTSLAELRQQVAHGTTRVGAGSAVPSWDSPETTFAHLAPHGSATVVQQRLHNDAHIPLLDDVQRVAASPDRRLTIIVGAAGSGKSKVLIERLIATLGIDQRGRPRHVLVTAYNIAMVDQLAEWFNGRRLQIGRGSVLRRSAGDHVIVDAGRWHVTFLNWDKVIARCFETDRRSAMGEVAFFRKRLETAVKDPVTASWLAAKPHVTAEFLDEELRRVVFGQRALTRDDYLKVQRVGRPHRPSPDDRRHLWQLMMVRRQRLFTDRRIEALDAPLRRLDLPLITGTAPVQFDDIFIDECQDFLPADLHLASRLVSDPRRIVCAGDETQSGNTGSSYRRPASINGARWKKHSLSGSYRLPIRVCEAVHPLATAIAASRRTHRRQATDDTGMWSDEVDLVQPTAVKSAVLGTRPIVLAGLAADVDRQFMELCSDYRRLLAAVPDSAKTIWVAEGDSTALGIVARAAEHPALAGYRVADETIRAIKGLERPLVVWSLRSGVPPGMNTAEWIYTLITRTTGLAVLMLSDRASDAEKAVVARLAKHRLLFWTPEAEVMFDSWRALAGTEVDPLGAIPPPGGDAST